MLAIKDQIGAQEIMHRSPLKMRQAADVAHRYLTTPGMNSIVTYHSRKLRVRFGGDMVKFSHDTEPDNYQ